MPEVKLTQLLLICCMLHWGNCTYNVKCSKPNPQSLNKALGGLFNDSQVFPVGRFSTLNVSIKITVVAILGVNERSQILSTVIWQVLQWNIGGLSWNETTCGTNRVSVLRENLWVPDIYISEFTEEDKTAFKPPYVYLNSTGYVYDDQPLLVQSSCKLVTYTFPFDIQNCSLSFGSYLHFDTDIQMFLSSTRDHILNESKEVVQTNGEWELADIFIDDKHTVVLEVGNYSRVQFFIVLRRRPLVYVVTLLLPSCFLLGVDLFSFLLPTQSVDRCSFKMTLLLGYTVFLFTVSELLPVTGGSTPLISVFFSVSLALMVASLLETVLITNLQNSSSKQVTAPHWFRVLVLQYLSVVVCLSEQKRKTLNSVFHTNSNKDSSLSCTISHTLSQELQSVSDDSEKDSNPTLEELRKLRHEVRAIRVQVDKHREENISQEWVMIGLVLDRLLFSLYLVFISVSFLVIVFVWIWSTSYCMQNE
ncbi:5-hydroxytryptamine receptor 3A-like [Betta splendens]|uniref:5-hydroxytryptamine receptor 3A-like n=1 Tax=Betta splendens TaxID=158456 RepID=A0A8M1HCV4_BETSP|nr:5-hydroxytryptamine receptor 3A-like [Betta splendens]